MFDVSDETAEGCFHEFEVEIRSVDTRDIKTIELSVWAQGYEEALTCGEILSAVYLG